MPTFADNESGASVRTKINAVITTVDTNSATWNAAISDGGTAASLTITSADINRAKHEKKSFAAAWDSQFGSWE